MWSKPDGEDLLPAFMQSAMGFCAALAVFFGLPAVSACVLIWRYNQSFTLFPVSYMYTLETIFKNQNVFYLIHLIPAFAVRFFYGQRLKGGGAFAFAVFLSVAAVLLTYSPGALANLQTLKDIAFFIVAPPLLMAFFILRINKLLASGSLVILIFLGLLCAGFFK